ncbi:TPA: hypothetical protein DEB29_00485 [Candidatus Wolfebacteria bacterium]|nr:hypothetical protein [Candidatus Wolfebacteria bacterium]
MAHNEQQIGKYIIYTIGIIALIGGSIVIPLYEVLGGTGAALAIHAIVVALLVKLLWTTVKTIQVRMQGAGGELGVRITLRGLDDRFRVLGSVVIGNKGDMDFVVVGPTGVWVIEVKSHKGRIRVENNRLLRDNRPFDKDFLRQVWGATYALKDTLRARFPKVVHVQPVVVFSSPYAKLGVELNKADNAYVIGIDQLIRLIERHEVQQLRADEVQKITDCIREAAKKK